MVNVFLLQAPKPYSSEKYLHKITALFQNLCVRKLNSRGQSNFRSQQKVA